MTEFQFLILGVKIIFFGGGEFDNHLRELSILRILVHFICILLRSLFLVIIKHLSILDQKWHDMGHLHRYNSKKKSILFSEIMCNGLKLMYKEVCQVLVRYL